MLAVLEVTDFVWIAAIVFFCAGGATWFSARPSEAARIRRVEAKLDMVCCSTCNWNTAIRQSPGGLSEDVKALADDPAQKIAAIALLRRQTGIGLKEAKDAVEGYIAGRG